MKCDELKRKYSDITGPYYGYNEVNEAIAELMKEILNLKAKNIELQSFYDLHGNVDNYIDKLKAENAELKQKLENVQASMYCDVVDANMENRRLRRALWIARAERARTEQCYENYSFYIHRHQKTMYGGTYRPYIAWLEKWNEVERKCLKKAEEYK